ncbi:homoserine dehydrogenase [Desulfotomaculum arcticum]|uniref:Homoserine dehydrogenase n=1 Tax=Desulfotruncus arcticus DSM 17038 TaxID=1121424 RepID=A0A1I2MVE5_9FIRM|nr:homoserine dehydrogenase [Desulfotruncus arcticus]SFF95068.1 homoserine dehydrogenase [Desulfotomaculum arcticum] [Desulfotruncus arcticus DSM 17038]
MSVENIKIGMLGLGTVGRGVYRIITGNGENIKRKIGAGLEIKKILVRDLNRDRGVELDQQLLTGEINDIMEDPEIKIVIEVMGGIEPTLDFVQQALQNGKSVVTANKDMIAVYGKQLFELAEANRADLLFEASVAGGIPIIRPLKQCLAANRINQVIGIINGTTNYMLTKMTKEGSDFAEVLREAQDKGYAEANPASDIEGYDAARKLAILASIAFNSRVVLDDVYTEGITKITATDISYAGELNYTVKLLGIAKETEEGVEVRVHPTLIPVDHPLAAVNDVFNAIFVSGDAVGDTMFYGRGAGELPTASAVVSDAMDAARDLLRNVPGIISCTCYDEKPVKDMGLVESRYYIRIQVSDKPGVLASIAYAFSDKEVSLATVLQKQTDAVTAEIVLVTHKVREKNMQEALEIIKHLSSVKAISNVIRVEGD